MASRPPLLIPAHCHPRFWLTWLLLGAARLVARLPPGPGLALGRGLGRLGLRIAGERQRIARINLALCFPTLGELERQRLLRRHFQSLGMALMETAWCWCLPPDRLRDRLRDISGEHHLREALNGGRGVIVLAAHFTHLEIGSTLLGLHYPGAAVYRPHRNSLLETFIQRRRGRHNVGGQLIPKARPRGMLKILRENHFLWYAADQDYRGAASMFVPFFGVLAASNAAIIRLARLSSAPVLPFYQERLDDGGYRLVFLPPLENFPTDDPGRDMACIHRILEAMIRRQPADYLWVHRRFKTRPPGERPIYARSRKL